MRLGKKTHRFVKVDATWRGFIVMFRFGHRRGYKAVIWKPYDPDAAATQQ